jgi:hypothetical protein
VLIKSSPKFFISWSTLLVTTQPHRNWSTPSADAPGVGRVKTSKPFRWGCILTWSDRVGCAENKTVEKQRWFFCGGRTSFVCVGFCLTKEKVVRTTLCMVKIQPKTPSISRFLGRVFKFMVPMNGCIISSIKVQHRSYFQINVRVFLTGATERGHHIFLCLDIFVVGTHGGNTIWVNHLLFSQPTYMGTVSNIRSIQRDDIDGTSN